MDWTTYAEIAAVATGLALLYVFLKALLKPIGKHLGQRVVRRLESPTEVEAAAKTVPKATAENNTDAVRRFVERLVDLLEPGLAALTETAYWYGAAVSAIGGAIILAFNLALALVLGLDPVALGVATVAVLATVGIAYLILARRREQSLEKGRPGG